jgi:hypothetical protein
MVIRAGVLYEEIFTWYRYDIFRQKLHCGSSFIGENGARYLVTVTSLSSANTFADTSANFFNLH